MPPPAATLLTPHLAPPWTPGLWPGASRHWSPVPPPEMVSGPVPDKPPQTQVLVPFCAARAGEGGLLSRCPSLPGDSHSAASRWCPAQRGRGGAKPGARALNYGQDLRCTRCCGTCSRPTLGPLPTRAPARRPVGTEEPEAAQGGCAWFRGAGSAGSASVRGGCRRPQNSRAFFLRSFLFQSARRSNSSTLIPNTSWNSAGDRCLFKEKDTTGSVSTQHGPGWAPSAAWASAPGSVLTARRKETRARSSHWEPRSQRTGLGRPPAPRSRPGISAHAHGARAPRCPEEGQRVHVAHFTDKEAEARRVSNEART